MLPILILSAVKWYVIHKEVCSTEDLNTLMLSICAASPSCGACKFMMLDRLALLAKAQQKRLCRSL